MTQIVSALISIKGNVIRRSSSESAKAGPSIQLFRSGEHRKSFSISALTILLCEYDFPKETILA